MTIKSLDEKFAYELSVLFDAEHQFLEAQRQMVQQATENNLKSMLEMHIELSEGQIRNLEEVFSVLGQEPKRMKSGAASGLVADAQKLIKEIANSPQLLDPAIGGAQAKVEHFEMACYRGLVTGAQQMGNQQVVKLLQQNLEQEEQTAQKIEQSMPQLLQQAMSANERSA